MRSAWKGVAAEPTSVVHADILGNVVIGHERVGLFDWDECRVDASLLDFALPLEAIEGVDDERLRAARRAEVAWEVACAWTIEPAFACKRLRELETI